MNGMSRDTTESHASANWRTLLRRNCKRRNPRRKNQTGYGQVLSPRNPLSTARKRIFSLLHAALAPATRTHPARWHPLPAYPVLTLRVCLLRKTRKAPAVGCLSNLPGRDRALAAPVVTVPPPSTTTMASDPCFQERQPRVAPRSP